MSHLHGLKDYMLLAKGDFYQSFLAESGRMMGLPAEKLANKDLGGCWLLELVGLGGGGCGGWRALVVGGARGKGVGGVLASGG